MRDAKEPNDERPPMADAMQWVSRVTTVSLEMALPPGLGYWADESWGTGPWLVILGAVFGFMLGMWHLLQMASEKQ